MNVQPTIFDGVRLTIREAIDLTRETMLEYGPRYQHWAIAWSGGKDSTTVLALIQWLLENRRIPAPKSLTVLYADTRMELPPLWLAAMEIRQELERRGVDVRTVVAPMDERFWVYMLGRGVPPPKNDFRWCTPQLKIEPMERALTALRDEAGEKILMLTGVRIGESAKRDESIKVACGRDGAECGQGWLHINGDRKNQNDINRYFVPSAESGITDTLAPILHWRSCLIWDFLMECGGVDQKVKHGIPTKLIADAYDQDADGSRIENSARTGCICCPLASDDHALRRIILRPGWEYLAPLFELRQLWLELRKPGRRLRKPGGETRKDGSLSKNQNRMGPLTLESRRWALDFIVTLQARINVAAAERDRPRIDFINREEIHRICDLIDANTWPDKWTGEEPIADEPFEDIYPDGSRQLLLPVLPAGGGN